MFFFKHKTAYELRISDWSSDVCSSDLGGGDIDVVDTDPGAADDLEIGRRVEDVLRDLGRRTDREAIILADDRLQLFGGLAGDLVDLDAACTKDRGGLGCHLDRKSVVWGKSGTVVVAFGGLRILKKKKN